jgi:hypothetical protein
VTFYVCSIIFQLHLCTHTVLSLPIKRNNRKKVTILDIPTMQMFPHLIRASEMESIWYDLVCFMPIQQLQQCFCGFYTSYYRLPTRLLLASWFMNDWEMAPENLVQVHRLMSTKLPYFSKNVQTIPQNSDTCLYFYFILYQKMNFWVTVMLCVQQLHESIL